MDESATWREDQAPAADIFGRKQAPLSAEQSQRWLVDESRAHNRFVGIGVFSAEPAPSGVARHETKKMSGLQILFGRSPAYRMRLLEPRLGPTRRQVTQANRGNSVHFLFQSISVPGRSEVEMSRSTWVGPRNTLVRAVSGECDTWSDPSLQQQCSQSSSEPVFPPCITLASSPVGESESLLRD